MPYIKEDRRNDLDNCIDTMIKCIKNNMPKSNSQDRAISNEQLLDVCGDINYCFSRILGSIMGNATYPKIAIITGVLENIKQEFYRRVGISLEDKKILENGDIPEYKKLC